MQKNKSQKAQKLFEQDRALINKALKKYLQLKGPVDLKNAMQYAVLNGGKRLRPILTLEVAKLFGGNVKKALPNACAVELVHNFSLVHDDLPSMDNDDYRRGKLTCHKKFGEALALLAGDGLLNLAFFILAKDNKKYARKTIIALTDAIGSSSMIGGQVLDVEYEKRGTKNKNLKEKIDKMKTAALMSSACALGAIAAGASEKNIKKIKEFGINLGKAFQIVDDIRDGECERSQLQTMKKRASFYLSKSRNMIKPYKKNKEVLGYLLEVVLKRAEIKK